MKYLCSITRTYRLAAVASGKNSSSPSPLKIAQTRTEDRLVPVLRGLGQRDLALQPFAQIPAVLLDVLQQEVAVSPDVEASQPGVHVDGRQQFERAHLLRDLEALKVPGADVPPGRSWSTTGSRTMPLARRSASIQSIDSRKNSTSAMPEGRREGRTDLHGLRVGEHSLQPFPSPEARDDLAAEVDEHVREGRVAPVDALGVKADEEVDDGVPDRDAVVFREGSAEQVRVGQDVLHQSGDQVSRVTLLAQAGDAGVDERDALIAQDDPDGFEGGQAAAAELTVPREFAPGVFAEVSFTA